MINDARHLIQKYAEAREQMEVANNLSGQQYWKGVMDTCHSLLVFGFNDWAFPGSVGYLVFYEGMSWDAADYLINN